MGRRQSIEQQERARQAADMKIAGASWVTIAEELGYETEAGPRLLVRKYFEGHAREQWAESFPIMRERGELLWRQAYQSLMIARRNGDLDGADKAMRRGLDALTYLSRITGVLDGPTVTVNVDASRSVESLRAKFREIEAAEHPIILDDTPPPQAPDLHE